LKRLAFIAFFTKNVLCFFRSKSNDALQANLEKVQEIKDKVEGNLKKEQLIDQKAKEEISIKDHKIKSLSNDLENSKQASQNCREEFVSFINYYYLEYYTILCLFFLLGDL
jgi:signal transduction histidine kinase